MSTTVSPSSGFEKNVGASARLDEANTDFNPLVNRGTSCSNQPSGNVIWYSCSACHAGFSGCAISVSPSTACVCSFILVTLCSLAFLIHSVVCFRMASYASHSVVFPFDLVVTCCISTISAITILNVGRFSLLLTVH